MVLNPAKFTTELVKTIVGYLPFAVSTELSFAVYVFFPAEPILSRIRPESFLETFIFIVCRRVRVHIIAFPVSFIILTRRTDTNFIFSV